MTYTKLTRLKSILDLHRITYEMLAEKLNRTPCTVSNKINGKAAFNSEELKIIKSYVNEKSQNYQYSFEELFHDIV